jgi:MFS transporter, PPP family, 3-phenylpropionic acid transporter
MPSWSLPSAPALITFLVLFALLYGAFGVHSPFFPSFLSARGLAPEAIGVVLAAGTVIRLLAAPIAGRIADSLDAPRAVLALTTLAASLIALGYLGAWGFWPLLLMNLASAIALGPVAPVADALALSAAERRRADGRRAFDYGWVRGVGSAAFVAGSLLSGQAIARFGLTVILWLHAALLALASLCAIRVPRPEPPVAPTTGPFRSMASAQSAHGIRRLLEIPLYRRVLVVAALVFGSHAMHDSFAVIRWGEAGIGPGVISVLWSESVTAEVVVFFLIGPWLLDRLGTARAAALCAAAGLLRWIVMAQTAWLPALMLVQPLHGLTFALLHLACMRLLSHIVPPGLLATALTLYGTLGAGVSSVVLTLASGPLYGRLGPGGFWAMAVLCALAIPLALTLKLPSAAGDPNRGR